jgi:hypothetical protein
MGMMIIHSDSNCELSAQDSPPSLNKAREMLGGDPEVLELYPFQLLFSRQALGESKPVNVKASQLAQRTICGTALLLSGNSTYSKRAI